MPAGQLRVLSTIPGGVHVGPVVQRFAQLPDALVTAFSDAPLANLKRLCGDDCRCEVVPFGQVIRRFARMSGVDPPALIGGENLASAVGEALKSVGPSCFAPLRYSSGMAHAIAQLIHELDEWGYDPDRLRRSASSLPEALAVRLVDLSELWDELNERFAAGGFWTVASLFRQAMGSVADADGSSPPVLVFGGSRFVPLLCDATRALVGAGCDVTVIVHRHASDAEGVFAGSRSIIEALGTPCEPLGQWHSLSHRLFGRPTDGGFNIEVGLEEVPDALQESERALRFCAEGGGSAVLFARNLDFYGPLLESASDRLDIPISITRKVPLACVSLPRLLDRALEWAATGSRPALLDFVSNSLVGPQPATRDEIVSLMVNANGVENASAAHPTQSAGIDWFRRLVAECVQARQQTRSISAWQTWFSHTLAAIIPWSKHLDSVGSVHIEERDIRGGNEMQRSVASAAFADQLFGGPDVDLRHFLDVCRRTWSAARVVLPCESSKIEVYDTADLILPAHRAVAVGLVEGSFPKRPREHPILPDRVRWELNKANPDLHPLDDSVSAGAERDEFYSLVCAPSRALRLSTSASREGKETIPALYLRSVAEAVETIQSVPEAHNPGELSLPSDRPQEEGRISNEVSRALAMRRSSPIEVSTAARIHECPFRFVVTTSLRFSSSEADPIWHVVARAAASIRLEAVEQEASAERQMLEAVEDECSNAQFAADTYTKRLVEEARHRAVEMVRREFGARALWRDSAPAQHVPFKLPRAKYESTLMLGGENAAVSFRAACVRRNTANELLSAVFIRYGGVKPVADRIDEGENVAGALLVFKTIEAVRSEIPVAFEVDDLASSRKLYPYVPNAQASLNWASDSALRLSVDDVRRLRPWPGQKMASGDAPRNASDSFGEIEVDIGTWFQHPEPQAIAGPWCASCPFGDLCRVGLEWLQSKGEAWKPEPS